MDLTDSTLTFEEFLENRSLEEIEVQKQIENSMKTNNESVKLSEMGGRVAEKKKNQSVTESSNINTSKLTREDIREIMDKEVKKMTKDTTIQNILWENVEVKVSDPCESDESDGSFERFEDQFYRQMDRIDSTKAENVTAQGDGPAECNLTANVKTRGELKKVLTAEPKELNEEEREYREMLKWDLRLPEQNIPILKPIERKESESEDTMIEMSIKCQKEVKPEFEITPPKDIAEENDVILYTKNMDSINCPKYRSMYTEMDKKIEGEIVKTTQVYKKLNMSQNYSVFQKNQEKIGEGGEEEEEHLVENALIAANKISEVRDQMSDFTRKLAEFNEQSRQAKE
ncbi:hypothetical protein JTB14_017722 [Gonioctena quinquepunctata]|nr:hypothetical protein JTB14_017722 [Gonioctena quinquepunctata]